MPSKAVTDANTAAQRLHARLHTDYTKPIDVFSVVQQEGIWLVSRPLSAGLYGFYLREGDAAGIVLNADHPEYLQRYTCAHELGHHVLGHRSHLDQPDDVVGPTAGHPVDEVATQAFAGAFLMPLQAINRVLRRLGMPKSRRLDAPDVYAISRELDVSFSASAWQLAALGRIPFQDADRFAKQGAKAAKDAMRPGPPPEGDNRAALFIVEPDARDVPILCRPGDELRLRLPENAATGHIWRIHSPEIPRPAKPQLRWDGRKDATKDAASTPANVTQDISGESLLRLAENRYHPSSLNSDQPGENASVVGQPGTRELVFLVDGPGRAEFNASLSRPWEADRIDTFSITVRIGPAHALNGFAVRQVREHAARVAEG